MPPQNPGYIPDIVKEEDWIFGAQNIPDDILQPDGQWDAYLPSPEDQLKNSVETANCTGFGTLNALEMIMRRKFNLPVNYSDRYTGINAGTYPPGNSPQTVIESIRKDAGVIDEYLLPFDQTIQSIEQYYSPKPMIAPLLDRGKRWLGTYQVNHEWVFTSQTRDKKVAIKEALKHSPLGASVFAWMTENGLYVKLPGFQDNHWICIYGYEEGKYWKILDQYEPYIKRLEWNFDFGQAKRYYVTQLATPPPVDQMSWFAMVLEWCREWFWIKPLSGFAK